MKYRKTNKLSLADKTYLAGFIDGEGTITLSRRNKGRNRQLAITISNNELEILEWVKNLIGVGTIIIKKIYSKKHNQSYTYHVFNRQALSLIKQIIPHLKGYKKERAKLVLDNYLSVTPRNGKYSEEVLKQKEKFEKKFFKIKP
jgi:hypothetical protein